jgi:hypothetical protein
VSRKSVHRFCGNDMREIKDLKWQANLKDRGEPKKDASALSKT